MGAPPQEASSDPPYYPRGGTYADFLAWHLFYWGTREGGGTAFNGQVWLANDFVREAFVVKGFDAGRTGLNNWLAEAKPPNSAPNEVNHGRIKATLFGADQKFDLWRKDFDQARERSTLGRNRKTKKFPDPPPIPPTIQVASASIPRLTSYFLGRDDERDSLVAAILSEGEAHNALLIQGGPGMGKTELTKAIAHDEAVIKRFGARRWFVRLETASTADAMQQAIARELGCDPKNGFQAVLQFLSAQPSLVILDNLETPWESSVERQSAEEVLAALAAITGLTLIASFRGLAKVGGPRWYEHPLDELLPKAAIELFESIAGTWVKRDPHCSLVMSALGGIPLAIQLVARRAYGCATLAPLWQEWLRIGTAFAADPDFEAGRLTSLSHSIELSLQSQRMTEEAGHLLRILGALPDGVAIQDVDKLIGKSAFAARERLRNIGMSIETSLRIQLLPPIRDHAARSRALMTEDRKIISEHYISKFVSLAYKPSLYSHGLRHIILQDEINNIYQAFIFSLELNMTQLAINSLKGFEGLWLGSTKLLMAVDLIEKFCIENSDMDGIAKCMLARGNYYSSVYEDETDTMYQYEKSLDNFKKSNNYEYAAIVESRIAFRLFIRKKYESAEICLLSAIHVHQKVGSEYWEGISSLILAQIYVEWREHQKAIVLFYKSLNLFEILKEYTGWSDCILQLASAHLDQGEKSAARTLCQRAVDALLNYQPKDEKFDPYSIDTRTMAYQLDTLSKIALCCEDGATAEKAINYSDSLYLCLGENRH